MPKQITAWQAKNGSIHGSACEAAACDLEAIVMASPMAENAPFARKLVDWLKGDAHAIAKVLAEYIGACPIAAEEESPAISPGGTQG